MIRPTRFLAAVALAALLPTLPATAQTPVADVLKLKPDGIFLANGPGDPQPCDYAIAAAREQRGTVVSRAALGLSWVALPPGADVAAVRDAVAPRPVAVLDGAALLEDAWPAPPPGTLAVMARLKERFDPARIFRPGAYVGGL